MNSSTRILRAAWILPIIGPPIENGEVVIEGDRIAAVRPATNITSPDVEEFGDAVILPGLVNVHTHLDYTVMRGLLEDLDFFPWIRELTARAMTLTPEDWLASAAWGAAEALAGGVTTIGDCTFSGAALNGAKALGLGGIIYQEVFGIDEQRTVPEIVAELKQKVAGLQVASAGTRLQVGISPHAPYTVRPALFEALAKYAKEDSLPVCIHAAESRAEAELLRSGRGAFAEMYARRGIAWQIPGVSAVAYLDRLGILGPRALLVHGVQIAASDRAIIQEREVAWAHCPKSNAKLGVGVAPLGLLSDYMQPVREESEADRAAQSNTEHRTSKIGLGSDSVASNNTMDMFEEMRFAVLMQRAARHRIAALGAKAILEMATLGGARALGLDKEIGSLQPGKRADVCVVRLSNLHSIPAYDPYHALVYAGRASDVVMTLTAGSFRYDARHGARWEDRFPNYDLTPVHAQIRQTAQKMRDWRPPTS